MEIPDKIYLPIIENEGKKLLCTNWWKEDRNPQDVYVKQTIEYVRKDKILEILKDSKHLADAALKIDEL